MGPNCDPPSQQADCRCHAGLGQDSQAGADVVGNRMPSHEFDTSLSAQVLRNRADLTPKSSVEDFAPVLRYDHDVVLAIPLQMEQPLPFV